ncbi:MAG: ethanolamine permease [Leptospiraceae bacterium]|nr:ethanolamine permease [Leptospiraceae bacterium]MCP5494055.1 ethanolamine permease [Leptospiraceae bacterium]
MEKESLKKSLKPIHLWAIAVGLVISGDYFGWSYGYQVATPWEFLVSTVLISIFYICFAFSFTELTTAIPKAGGPFAYSRKALGDIGGFIAGFATLVEFLFAPPAIASALGAYLHFLIPDIPQIPAAVAAIVLFTLINLLGVYQTARFELFVTIIASFGILLYILQVAPHFDFKHIGLSGNLRWSSVFATIPFSIWFYLALEGVAMAAEETENPTKDIPLGYSLGIGTLVFFAMGIMILTSGLGISEELSKTDNPLPRALLFIKGEKTLLVSIFTFFGLFGIMASLLGIILGYSRQIFALSRENYLPKFLSHLNPKTHSPDLACLLGGVLGIIFILLGKTDKLITLSVMGAIVMYIISMVGLFVLRKKFPEMKRPYKTPLYPFLPAISLLLGIVCLISVVYNNWDLFLIFVFGFLLNLLLFLVRKKYMSSKA